MTRSIRCSLALAVTLTAGLLACDSTQVAADDPPLKTERGQRGKADGELAPAAWDCNASFYDTNDGCDCGCGVIDPDCDSGSIAACEYEWCDSGDPGLTTNWQCEDQGGATPGTWTCHTAYYDSNDGCDCGCGIPDPDCDSPSASSCEYEYCDSGEDVMDANNALCTESPGNGGNSDDGNSDDGNSDDGNSDGGSTSAGCSSTMECGAGYTCSFDYQGDPEHGNERLCRWDGLFSAAACEQTSGTHRDCYGSECLGMSHCGVGESCTVVAGTSSPNTRTECTD